MTRCVEVECDCACGKGPDIQHTDACTWPDCGCECQPECKGCALALELLRDGVAGG